MNYHQLLVRQQFESGVHARFSRAITRSREFQSRLNEVTDKRIASELLALETQNKRLQMLEYGKNLGLTEEDIEYLGKVIGTNDFVLISPTTESISLSPGEHKTMKIYDTLLKSIFPQNYTELSANIGLLNKAQLTHDEVKKLYECLSTLFGRPVGYLSKVRQGVVDTQELENILDKYNENGPKICIWYREVISENESPYGMFIGIGEGSNSSSGSSLDPQYRCFCIPHFLDSQE